MSNCSYICGQLIMKCKPFLHILNDKQKGIQCDHCFQLNDSLKKCSNCKSMFYCHQKCQKTDWKECHKNECKLYEKYYKKHLFRDCDRFLLRFWLFINNNIEKEVEKYELYNGSNRCLNDLKTHYYEIQNDTKRMNCFENICERFEFCEIDFDYEKLFKLFCMVCINSFSILNEDLNEIGTALYISASILNHSCQPNAAPVFNGIYLEIRSLKTIASDEEIFINYIDLKTNRNDRQIKLYEQYYFNCNCIKCVSHSDHFIDYAVVQKLDKELDEMITNEKDWQKCCSIGMQSIPFYYQIYGDFHPDLTVQLMRVLKLKVLITHNFNDQNMIEFINKTKNSIIKTHGIEHNLYKIFRETIGF